MDTGPEIGAETAWRMLLAAKASPPDAPDGAIIFENGSWSAQRRVSDAVRQMFDLYATLCRSGPARPMTIGHLGQSLDGRIATEGGSSHYVTGEPNRLHLQRVRALCDAVVVGASTVAHDDPLLTVRDVEGVSPVRVIVDPRGRLSAGRAVFKDGAAETILVRGGEMGRGRARHGKAEVAALPVGGAGFDPADVLGFLHGRGLYAVFVEGGGVTVSSFLAAGVLDRLQIAVAPFIIGSGRPGITLPVIDDLAEGLRPRTTVFRMGEDVLFDCDLRA